MLAKLQKPPACADCALSDIGWGYAPADGPEDARLLFVGEALGEVEAKEGRPFVGSAGSMFDRLLRAATLSREQVKVDNCVRCRPPDNWLDGAPWQHSALTHCSGYLSTSLGNPNLQVVVTLGTMALKQVMDLWGVEGITINNHHGTIHRDPTDRFWVVPTYHPSFLQRGATNLFDVARFDLQVAKRILQTGYTRRPVSLLIDPPVEQFRAWVATVKARVANQDLHWIPVDIETPDKEGGRDENELTDADRSTDIQRVNFSSGYDEGLTVPYVGPYIDLIEEVLTSGAWLAAWNKSYDESRLRFRNHQFLLSDGSPVTIIDLMWAAHHLQSDWPLGLGFWAPFYSDWGAWKHLAKEPGQDRLYAALDGMQTNRVGPYGIVPALMKDGLWDAFWRHTHTREQYVLRPSHEVGVPVDVERLDHFHEKLQGIAGEKLAAINSCEMTGTLRPKLGYAKKPKGDPPIPPKSILGKSAEKGDQAKQDYLTQGVQLVERQVEFDVRVCSACGKAVRDGHNCLVPRRRKGVPEAPAGDPPAVPLCDLQRRCENRWFWQLPFNPDSPQQLLRFIKETGEEPGRTKKSKKPTSDKATLKKLAKKTGNPVYTSVLDYKAVKKVDSTYVVGSKRRLWSDGRLHPTITFRPSMFRDSCVNPNLQNVVGDKEGRHTLAAGFRNCIVADPGYRLIEIDLAATEALDTSWLCGDKNMLRLSAIGIHSYLASHLLVEDGSITEPMSLDWSDEDLVKYGKDLKAKFFPMYDRSKRCIYGNFYGLTTYGMHETFPESFHTLKDAERTQGMLYSICPALAAYHARVRYQAYDQGYLGGSYVDDYTLLSQSGKHHPWGYRHWFWGVQSFRPLTQKEYLRLTWIAKKKLKLDKHPRVAIINRKPFEIVLGEDSKRVIAIGPQSITAGKLKEAQLSLFHPDSPTYIGEAADGKTPLLCPIHDSLLLHVPDRVHEMVVSIGVEVMRRPAITMPMPAEWGMGSHLRTNVDVKVSPVGGSWADCESIKIPDMAPATAVDGMYMPAEDEEWSDVEDLRAELLA